MDVYAKYLEDLNNYYRRGGVNLPVDFENNLSFSVDCLEQFSYFNNILNIANSSSKIESYFKSDKQIYSDFVREDFLKNYKLKLKDIESNLYEQPVDILEEKRDKQELVSKLNNFNSFLNREMERGQGRTEFLNDCNFCTDFKNAGTSVTAEQSDIADDECINLVDFNENPSNSVSKNNSINEGYVSDSIVYTDDNSISEDYTNTDSCFINDEVSVSDDNDYYTEGMYEDAEDDIDSGTEVVEDDIDYDDSIYEDASDDVDSDSVDSDDDYDDSIYEDVSDDVDTDSVDSDDDYDEDMYANADDDIDADDYYDEDMYTDADDIYEDADVSASGNDVLEDDSEIYEEYAIDELPGTYDEVNEDFSQCTDFASLDKIDSISKSNTRDIDLKVSDFITGVTEKAINSLFKKV